MRKVGVALILILFVLGATGGLWLYVEKKTRDDFYAQLRAFEAVVPKGTQIVHGLVRIDIIGRRGWVENLVVIKPDSFRVNLERVELLGLDIMNSFRSEPKRPSEYRVVVNNGEIILPRSEARDKVPLRFGSLRLTGRNLGTVVPNLLTFHAAKTDAELLDALRVMIMDRKLTKMEMSDVVIEDPRDNSDPDEVRFKRLSVEELNEGQVGRLAISDLKSRLSKGRMDIRIDRLNSGRTGVVPVILDLSASGIKGDAAAVITGVRDLLEKSMTVNKLTIKNLGLRRLTDEIFVNEIDIGNWKADGLTDKVNVKGFRLEPSACRRDCLEIEVVEMGANNLPQAIGQTVGALVAGEIDTEPHQLAGRLIASLDTASLNMIGANYRDRQTTFDLGRVTADAVQKGIPGTMSVSRGEWVLPRQLEVQVQGADLTINPPAEGAKSVSGQIEVSEFQYRPDGAEGIAFEQEMGVESLTFNAAIGFEMDLAQRAMTLTASRLDLVGQSGDAPKETKLVGVPDVAKRVLGVFMGQPALTVTVGDGG